MTLRAGLCMAGIPLLALGAFGCEPIKAGECTADSECKGYEHCDTGLGACVLRTCSNDVECGLEGRCETANGFCGAAPLCTPGCPSYEACAHGACTNRYSGITILQPADGGTVGSPALVQARLEVVAPFARNDPASLELSITPGTTQGLLPADGGGGLYFGTWNPTVDQTYQLQVAYPDAGIQSASISVHADLTPPALTITVPPPNRRPDDAGWAHDGDDRGLNAWRRDESATVQVAGNEALDPTSVQLKLYGIGDGGTLGPLETTMSLTTPCGTNCFEGSVDLGQPMMRVGRGTMEVFATAKDTVGNAGDAGSGIEVTRVRWVLIAPDPIKTSPAVGPSGRIYFGTTNGSNRGALWAVDSTGELKWTVDAGAMEASAAVGHGTDGGVETVYAAFNATGASVIAAFDLTGADVHRCLGYTGRTYVGLGIGNTRLPSSESVPLESAFIVVNQGSGLFVALRPAATTVGRQCMESLDSSGIGAYPAAAAVVGTNVFFPDTSTSVSGFKFGTSGWAQLVGWPADIGTTAIAVITRPSDVLGTAGSAGKGGAFAISSTDGGVAWKYPQSFSTGSVAWPAALSDNGLIYATGTALGSTSLQRVVPYATTGESVAISSVSNSAPVISNDGMVYVAGTATDGLVETFRPDLSSDWTLDLTGSVLASPNMDCRRDPSGTRQSGHATLYVATMSGRLYSIITDSNGIDTTAPWPRYQHDPRNTGNADVPLSEFACP